MRTLLLLVLTCCVLAAQTPSGEVGRHTAEQRYQLFQKNLAQRAAAITRDQFQGIANLEQWKQKRPIIRKQFLDMLGLEPLPPRTPLNARVTSAFDRDGYRVENIVFESMPGLFVTGNLYLPGAKGVKPPVIVYVSGHNPHPAGAKFSYQHHGVWFARNGFAAFVLDTIEFGEIPGIHHGTYNLGMWHWLSLGYTPASVEVWNAIRALDYLETRNDVDPKNAGITGRSGGGAVTWFTAAADDRFQAAAPVHGTWAVGPHVADDVVRQNCDCIYFWNTYQLDLPVVGALIAPRPLKIINATKDAAFPPSGYKPVYQCLRPVYEWYQASGKLAEFDDVTGHEDLPVYRKEANEWLNQWMRNDRAPYVEPTLKHEEPSRLTVLEAYPANARNEGIDRTFIRTPKPQAWKTLADWRNRREQLMAALKDKVFRIFPKEKVPFNSWKGRHNMWTENYAESYNIEFSTEESLRVHGQLFLPRNGKSSHPALIFVREKEDIVTGVDYDRLLSAFADHVVLVVNPRAVDYKMDNFRIASTKMTAALLGGTLETLQLWDILRSIDYLTEDQKLNLTSISVYAKKHMGGLALHAAALDGRISRVILDDPPGSHWQGPALLNVLRFTDLPEVAAVLAPREIVSLTPAPDAYRYTDSIFRLHGKKESIRQASSLGEALQVWQTSK